MKNYIGPGQTMRAATGTARSSGDVFSENQVLGVVANDVTDTEEPLLHIEGVFRLPKAAVAISAGALVNWDASAGTGGQVTTGATAAAGDVTDFGIAMETVVGGDSYVNVKLLPGNGTFT